MPTRTNACSELSRFWLEARHGCLVSEGVPVPVPYALSDIDLVAQQPRDCSITLPGGKKVRPRLIVETKDEHDWEATGREFGAALRSDFERMAGGPWIPKDVKGVKFTMLRQQHFERAVELFGSDQFDRLFIVHAIDPAVLADLGPSLEERRIYWITIRDVVRDLQEWYLCHKRPAALRNTLMGDAFHLLVGFCGLRAPTDPPGSGA